MTLLTHRSTCRICESSDLELVLPLAPTPIAGAFASSPDEAQTYFPLDVYLCGSCGLVQLLDVVDPVLLYRTAMERTARDSPGMKEHFERYAFDMRRMTQHGAFVVEIGSNDGCFLMAMEALGCRALGIDPGTADEATVQTDAAFFSSILAGQIAEQRGQADVIVANNVLANIDDLSDLAEGIRTLLKPDGFFVFETGYLGDLVANLVFDNIYHEHLSYFAVRPLVQLFAKHGLELFDVQRVDTKGGSLRGFVQHYHGPRPHTTESVKFFAQEEAQRLSDPGTYRDIGGTLDHIKGTLCDVLTGLQGNCHDIIGYGASHSVVTLLHHFDIAQYLDYVVDDNPVKHGLFTPGHHLPVRAPSVLESADYAVVLPWRFAPMIMAKHADYQGRFIVPVPEVRIL